VAKRAVRGVDGSPIRASPRISPFAMGCQWFAQINLGHGCWCQDLAKSGTSHLCQIVPLRVRHKNAAPVAVAHIRRKVPRIAAASHHHGTPRNHLGHNRGIGKRICAQGLKHPRKVAGLLKRVIFHVLG
jgi:hypothetical protein